MVAGDGLMRRFAAIVTLFEAGKVEFDAQVGTHYNQGKAIGHAVND